MTPGERAAWWIDLQTHCLQKAFANNRNELVLSVDYLAEALIQDNKIMVCGNGGSSANAQALVAMLINRYHRERPALPAFLLTADQPSFSSIVGESSFSDVYARSLRALGKPGDILVCLSVTGQASNILQAIEAAHDRDMRVIALTGFDGGDVVNLLHARDLSLLVPFERHALIHSIHLDFLHCIAHLLDERLFGEEDYSELNEQVASGPLS